jgi:hypothetical protein
MTGPEPNQKTYEDGLIQGRAEAYQDVLEGAVAVKNLMSRKTYSSDAFNLIDWAIFPLAELLSRQIALGAEVANIEKPPTRIRFHKPQPETEEYKAHKAECRRIGAIENLKTDIITGVFVFLVLVGFSVCIHAIGGFFYESLSGGN